MNLDNMMTIKQRRVRPKRKRKPLSKDERLYRQMQYIIRKAKTGDIDPEKKSHQILISVAQSKGYLDKDLNVIREAVKEDKHAKDK